MSTLETVYLVSSSTLNIVMILESQLYQYLPPDGMITDGLSYQGYLPLMDGSYTLAGQFPKDYSGFINFTDSNGNPVNGADIIAQIQLDYGITDLIPTE